MKTKYVLNSIKERGVNYYSIKFIIHIVYLVKCKISNFKNQYKEEMIGVMEKFE